MSDSSPDTFLGSIFQLATGLAGMAIGLAGLGLSCILFLALVGAAFNLFFGSSPSIFEPFGGDLAYLLANVAELFGNVAVIIFSIVLFWLFATGKMDEILDDSSTQNQSVYSNQENIGYSQESTQNSRNNHSKPSNRNASLTDSEGHNNGTKSSDEIEFDEYGQIIREE